ncbi:MAG: VWA domain-containing protein [Acidobacteriia bacterium]|nr:VWA domain-containing protein [Terriglobia bacterium]
MKPSLRARLFVGAVILTAMGVRGDGQIWQDASPGVFKARTELVLVPVVVTDHNGKFVHGLGKEDFRLEHNGKLQALRTFEEVTARLAPVRRTELPNNAYTNELANDPNAKPLYIILVDVLNTPFENQVQGREALMKMLAQTVPTNALVGLAVLDINGLHVLHDFTNDPRILVSALRTATGQPALDSATRDAAASSLGEARQLVAMITQGLNAEKALQMASAALASGVVATSKQNQSIMTTLEAFRHIAEGVKAIPGRKALIWASGGFPFKVNTTTNEITGGVAPEVYRRTMEMLAGANVAMYPVDLSGLTAEPAPKVVEQRDVASVTPGRIRGEELRNPFNDNSAATLRQSVHEGMKLFAEITGGRAFYNMNDLSGAFQIAYADLSNFYLVGYYLAKDSKPGWQRLRVSVGKAAIQVRSRSGFFLTRSDDRTVREVDERMALESPVDYTGLPLTVQWGQIEGSAEKKANFVVTVAPGSARVDTERKNAVDIDFIAVVFDASGRKVAQVSQNFRADLTPETVQQIAANGVRYANTIKVPSGEYGVRFVVRDNLTGVLGSVWAPLKAD